VNIIMDGPPAMTLGVEPARPGIMGERPRDKQAAILSVSRMWRIGLYGATMAVGTLGVYAWAMQAGDAVGNDARAMTLAFTTFVLFQFFNIFNARAEHGSAFNAQLFSNGKLWLALLAVVSLQVVAVHWAPAQAIFDTVDLTMTEWMVATAVASSTLFLEEARKLLLHLFNRPTNG
jgi:Ca2+-transporting ATPase